MFKYTHGFPCSHELQNLIDNYSAMPTNLKDKHWLCQGPSVNTSVRRILNPLRTKSRLVLDRQTFFHLWGQVISLTRRLTSRFEKIDQDFEQIQRQQQHTIAQKICLLISRTFSSTHLIYTQYAKGLLLFQCNV